MHVIDGLPWGGAERMLVDIANATVARGERVSACVTRSCTDMAGCLHSDVRLHVLRRRRRFALRPLRRLLRLVREEKVDVLHAHSRSTFALLAVLKASCQWRVPVVFHDHYGSIERDTSVPAWFRFAGRCLLDHYVGVHAKLGEWAEQAGVPKSRIDVIGNAIDVSRVATEAPGLNLSKTFELGPATQVGVVIAGIRPDKGIDVLVRALALRPLPTVVTI